MSTGAAEAAGYPAEAAEVQAESALLVWAEAATNDEDGDDDGLVRGVNGLGFVGIGNPDLPVNLSRVGSFSASGPCL